MKKYAFVVVLLSFFIAAVLFFNNQKISKKAIIITESNEKILMPLISKDKIWGEPAKDMFPDITNPVYVTSKKANLFMRDNDEVLLLKSNKNTYVYPVNILSFHHIVNDTIDIKPVAITYCLLADAGVTFDRVIDGKTIELGVLGPLYAGNLVLYNKTNDSYYLQLTGQVFPESVDIKNLKQTMPLTRTLWKDIRNKPNITILAPENEMAFYRDFYEKRKDSKIGLNSLLAKKIPIDTRLEPLTRGYGVVNGNSSTFIPLEKSNNNAEMIKTAQSATQVYWYVWSSFYPKTSISK